MDCGKVGALLLRLRKEKSMTQKQVAERLNLSDKTISKWERGLGCPDVGLWPKLSDVLGVDMQPLMEGEITRNLMDTGNLKRLRFYVCPACLNVLFSTGSASIYCCGRKLVSLTPQNDVHTPPITREIFDGEYFITIDHEMTRQHTLLFTAYVKNDKLILTRMYPEQNAQARIPLEKGGTLYLYCVKHGLAAIKLS